MQKKHLDDNMIHNNALSNISVTVIVCTYNRSESLTKTIACLAKQYVPKELQWDIVIVDNNSPDRTAEVVKSSQQTIPNLRYEFEKNQGLSHARNRGIDCATGEILLFTDDDVCPEPDWIHNIAQGMLTYNCDACGGYVAPNWEKQPPKWLTERFYGFLAVKTDVREPYEIKNEIDFPYGANMAIKRSVVDHVGKFDTNRGRKGNELASGEDDEMFARIIDAGYKAMYLRDARVHHRVESFRVEKKYFRKWRFQTSRNIVESIGIEGNRRLFGIPTYLFPQLVRSILRAAWARLAHPADEAFQKEIIVYHFLGTFTGLWRSRKSGNN